MSDELSTFPARSRRTLPKLGVFAASVVALVLPAVGTGAQFGYSKGQPVAPAYEGWEQAPDGSRFFVFGYMNRNWEEMLDIPVGPDNMIEPGGPDQGQPTHFFPRRNAFVFRIPIPQTFNDKSELIWTLTTHGVTEKAYATLNTDYFIDELVRAMELGAVIGGGALDPAMYHNKGPTLKIEGQNRRSVRVGQPLTLVAWAADDGVPKRRPARKMPWEGTGQGRGRPYAAPDQGILTNAPGLRLSWFVYRGNGGVSFSPEQTEVWEDTRPDGNSPWAPFWSPPPVPPDGKWIVEATFRDPGLYTLRCLASDGALGAYEDLVVEVQRN